MPSGTLYVVATPIGNLEDCSPRARRILSEVSVVACEDTRTTRKLLSAFDVSVRTVAYHQHSGAGRIEGLVDRLLGGESVAVVTENGTPAVADPGGTLVDLALKRGVKVEGVPGPSALATALSVSGFPANRVIFEGFLPVKGGKRRRAMEALAEQDRTIVIYEGPHRVGKTLGELSEVLGSDRPVTVCRELTKKFEEVHRSTLSEAAVRFSREKARGEFTVVIGAKGKKGMDDGR